MTDDPEGDRTHGRNENTAGGPDEYLRHHHRPEGWETRDHQRAARKYSDTSGNQRPLGPELIHQRPGGSLRDDTRDSAHHQRKADEFLIPMVAREVDRQERTDAGLDVGQEKVEPIETAQGRWGRLFSDDLVLHGQFKPASFPARRGESGTSCRDQA